jgi:hypothetical protein
MIENFPELNDSEVAILRAESVTGHVLDENFVLAIDNSQKVFTIVSNVDEALKIAKNIIEEKKGIECVIYDQAKKVLYHLNPQKPL